MRLIRIFTNEELQSICEGVLGHLEELTEAFAEREPLTDEEQFAAFHAVIEMCHDLIVAKYIDDKSEDADDELDFPTYLS